MTIEEAWALRAESALLMEKVARAFPCHRCDGIGERYPGHPCMECYGTGIQIPNEEEVECASD